MKEEFDKDHENLTKIEKHGTKIDRIFDILGLGLLGD